MAKKKKKMTKAQAAAARRNPKAKNKREYGTPTDTSGPTDPSMKIAKVVAIAAIVIAIVISAFVAVPNVLGK